MTCFGARSVLAVVGETVQYRHKDRDFLQVIQCVLQALDSVVFSYVCFLVGFIVILGSHRILRVGIMLF